MTALRVPVMGATRASVGLVEPDGTVTEINEFGDAFKGGRAIARGRGPNLDLVDSGAVGTVAIWGAVAAAGVSLGLGGVARAGARTAGRAAMAALVLSSAAVAALAWSLLTGNLALAYVADTTTRNGSWPYRLAGLWGGSGGSLLFWGWIVLVAGAAATRRRRAAQLVATAAGGSMVLVSAVAANPFRRLAIPAIDGGGLNPILQHPAMLYHPVLLYAGHAGLVAPFALVAGGAATGNLDQWWDAIRRWMATAWLLLGLGLVAGAHWAYVELGWGGFWGWDPVENSGLLPWLAATAFLHAARGRHAPDRRLVALAALPFCLSVLGAAISRSGAAQSVHAFAQASAVGHGMALLLAAAVSTVALASLRVQRHGAKEIDFQETAMTAGVVLLLAIAAVIAVGTVFPVLTHALTGQHVDVTPRYYAAVATPLVVLGAAVMGLAPSLRHRSVAWARTVVAALAVVVAAGLVIAPRRAASVALGATALAGVVLATMELIRSRQVRRAGALLAHLGMAVLLFGVAGSLLGHQSSAVVRPGAALSTGGFTLRYRDTVVDQGTGWQRVRTVVDVEVGGRRIAVLTPGLRVFAGQAAALSDVTVRSTPAEDLVVAVRAIDPRTGAAQLDVIVRPLVTLVWWGGLLGAAGGLLGLVSTRSQRRRRAHQAHEEVMSSEL